MNIPKELYKKFSSHRVAQFFFYLLFVSDNDGNLKTTFRQMAEDNELSIRRVSDALNELEFLGACETKTKQKGNKGGSLISICNYEFYEKTLKTCETKTRQKRNKKNIKEKVTKKNSFDYSFVEPQFRKPFEEWLKYKQSKNQMFKRQCDLELCYKKLKEFSDGNAEKATLIIEQSMKNNWSGLFELKKTSTPSTALKSSEMNYDKNNDW